MPRAVSIHIGVNQPRERAGDLALADSETTAWRMAELASQAGYESMLVLRGQSATRQAVHQALAGVAGVLVKGDTLFVSFSGHGGKTRDCDGDERCGSDESWCLYDGDLVDDRLAGYWRLFEPGVRIVVVSESCYSGGMRRTDHGQTGIVWVDDRGVMRGSHAFPGASCIGEPPRDTDEIRASVLLLTASAEEQTSRDGLFAGHLLNIWNGGRFEGSYCALFLELHQRVINDNGGQEPQIFMLGAADPGFPTAPAFRAVRPAPVDPHAPPPPVYRGGGSP